jgi:hypothetical protein
VSLSVSLPGHVVFRELPFCGVLLDQQRSRVYRLSQEASRVLRQALHGAETAGPYEPVIGISTPEPTAQQRERLLSQLGAQGLLRVERSTDQDDAP